MKLPWKTYPTGADVSLFDETLGITVQRNVLKRWVVVLRHVVLQHTDIYSGAVFPVPSSKTRDEAMTRAERWLEKHMRQLLGEGDTK